MGLYTKTMFWGATLEVKEIYARSIFSRSKILDYSISPYAGCEHSCVYCYARYTCRIYGKKLSDWGSFVYPKVNAPQLAVKEARRLRGGSIYISAVTDPYQPLESRYMLTRRILEVLLRYKEKFRVFLQTKSPLLLRDADLLELWGDRITVGVTITCNDRWSRVFEPRAPPTSERVRLLRKLRELGVRTYAFIGPIIPFITEPVELARSVEEYVDAIFFDRLNLRPGVWTSIKVVAERYELLDDMRNALFRGDFYREVKEAVARYSKATHVKVEVLF